MMDWTYRPIQWVEAVTPAAERRSRWTFRATWTDTLKLLDAEFWHLDARRVVLEADFREGDLRLDGTPRANAREPVFPGVRIAFDSRHGPLVYATDSHELWQHNVRAIALSLQALRAVDRYGVTHRAEQYTGWRAIGSGPTLMPGSMSPAAAAQFVAASALAPSGAAATILNEPSAAARLYRIAAKRLHPDAGGSTAEFQRLQDARTALAIP